MPSQQFLFGTLLAHKLVMQRSKMKIAIPIWNGCVSNVFDFAHQLLVVDAEDKKEISRSQVQLGQQLPQQKVSQLVGLGVDILICGTISRPLFSIITSSNIEVIPFVTGPVDQVLGAYFENRLAEPQFLQPGCGLGTRKHFRHKHGGKCGCGRGRGYRGGRQ